MNGNAAKKRRVLVVDDEPAITALLGEMLAYSGFDVLQANGGATALVLARSEHPDIVLLDVMMPDLDGRDACRALKMDSDLRKIVVVLFSSADEEDVHWKGAGADAFLQKPFRIRELPDFLRGLLRE